MTNADQIKAFHPQWRSSQLTQLLLLALRKGAKDTLVRLSKEHNELSELEVRVKLETARCIEKHADLIEHTDSFVAATKDLRTDGL